MQDRKSGGVDLFVRHRPVGRAEENRLIADLTDPAARTDRLVIDLDVRMQAVVLGKPFRVDRIRERRTRSVDLNRLRRCDRADRQRENRKKLSHHSSSQKLTSILMPYKVVLGGAGVTPDCLVES